MPERLYVHFLNLVGIEPFPPSVARADLTFWLSAVLDQPVMVPAGTQVATARWRGEPRESGGVHHHRRSGHRAAGVDRGADRTDGDAATVSTDVWDDLRYDGARCACFPSPDADPGRCVLPRLRRAAWPAWRAAVAVDADAEGIGVDPRNPPLAWEVWNGEALDHRAGARRHHRRAEPRRRGRAAGARWRTSC